MNNIDDRIVQMQFDNKQFENGVQTSIKSLDSLKKGLNLDASAKSLSNLEHVGRSFSLDGIASGVESLANRFSTLGIIGITALQNITNSAINAGKKIVSALTIDPIKTGFNEYETKMNAITTILTNTKSKGTTLDDVNKALNELNTYADKTIYNFSEMTRNIGTFTAAGVDLQTSVTSIKGIANLAAGSGSSAQQASTAMYQLSQALASGSVKLQDWNSVVNAGMGGELFQNALKDSAKELGIFVNEAKPFRETLKDGWLTTEVLTKTLERFSKDKSLVAAATQVKTFTQLFDTMKESVQSGWAVSWENIIGDKDEATAILTAISDAFNEVIGESADARNEMLSFWKDNGGKQAVLEGISNALLGFASVLEPIEKAFREIFPAMDGKKLVELSNAFKELTSGFKMGEKNATNLGRTFKGIFALLDIGVQAIKAVVGGIFDIVGVVAPAGDGILGFTAGIGDFLVKLNETVKSTNIFNKTIEKIGSIFKPVVEGLKIVISTIADVFASMSKVDTSGIDKLSDKISTRFEPLTKLGELLKSAFSGIGKILEKVAPGFYKLSSAAGEAFGNLQDSIFESIETLDFDSLFDIINGGLLAGILLAIKKFVSNAGSSFEGITGLLDGVKGSLEAWQSSLKAGTLLKIAGAMAILTASILVLSMIDSAKLASSMAAMTIMFVELFASMAVFDKIMSSSGFTAMGKITIALLGLSVSILILSTAVAKLSDLDWAGLAKGLSGVAGLAAILVGSAKLLSNSSGKLMSGALGLIAFSVAIRILVSAVRDLGALDVGTLAKGLIGVGVLCAELALFMKVTDLDGMGLLKGLGLLALAGAVNILATAVQKFSGISTGGVIQGLAAVGIILGELAIFINTTGNAKQVVSTAIGLTIIAASMLIFAEAISRMGSMSMEQLGKGLLAMAGALATITIALNLLPKNMIISGVGLIAIAGALVILSKALSSMGGMSWEEIGKGLLVLAGSLTIIAVAMQLMATALPGAAALLIIAGALTILAPVLKSLGEMSLSEIGLGLLALAGVFAVIGVAGLVLAPLTPIIIGLAGAITLFGIGCLAVGAGILAFSAGLAALAVSGTAGAAALVVIVSSIIGLIPMLIGKIGEGIILFAKVIINSAPVIYAAITTVMMGFIQAVITIIPAAVDAFILLVKKILETLERNVPSMVDTGMKLIIGFLKGIKDNIKEVVTTGIGVITGFLDGLASEIPKVIDSGINLMVSFINGMADGIRDNTDDVIAAGENLMDALIESAGKVLTASVEGFTDIGKNIIEGLINGMKGMVSTAATAAKNLGTSVLDAAKKALGIHSPSKLFKEVGQNIVQGMTKGIDDNSDQAVKASTKMSDNVTKASSGVVKKSNEAAKSAFDKAVAWIDDRKYYNKLSLEEELNAWEKIQNRYKSGSDERVKADKEVYRVKQEIRRKDYDDAVKNINDLKYYNKLSLEEELLEWKSIQVKYKNGTTERSQADKEVYRVKKEIRKQNYDAEVKSIDDLKYYNKLSLEEELASWKAIQKQYRKGTDERKQADKEVYRVKQAIRADNYSEEIETIDELKYYNKLSISDELKAWEVLQSKYKQGSEERKKADREVYRVQQEISSKRAELDSNYYAKAKELNDKLSQDIRSLNDEYDNAVKSRADSLYSSYNLFDGVDPLEKISGKELIDNLDGQIKAFDSWTKDLSDLSAKGLNEGLIKELQNAGPQSAAQIRALNEMSEPELQTYATLWQTKYNAARTQAVTELEGLRLETSNQILAITAQTQIDLEELRNTWQEALDELRGTSEIQLDDMEMVFNDSSETIKQDTTTKFTETAEAIKQIDWPSVGKAMCDGMIKGLNENGGRVAAMARKVAQEAYAAAKAALGINSPSKAFAELGMYTVEGFVKGIENFSKNAVNATSNLGKDSIIGLQNTIGSISDLITSGIDTQPVIRPVLDLTDVTANAQKLNGILDTKSLGSVGMNSINDISNKSPVSITIQTQSLSSQELDNIFTYVNHRFGVDL